MSPSILTLLTAWMPLLQMLALCMMRPLGIMVILPIVNARVLGGTLVRNALVLLLAIPVIPYAMASTGSLPTEAGVLVIWAISEIVVGLFIGFLASIPFWAIDVSGAVIDMVRGAGLAEVLSPASGQESSLFSLLLTQLLAAIFFATGGFNTLLEALYHSYTLLPLGKPITLTGKVADFLVAQSHLVLELGMQFALPAIAVMIMVDVVLGLVNRASEQIDVFFLAMPIKSLAACLVMALGIALALDILTNRFDLIGPLVERLFAH